MYRAVLCRVHCAHYTLPVHSAKCFVHEVFVSQVWLLFGLLYGHCCSRNVTVSATEECILLSSLLVSFCTPRSATLATVNSQTLLTKLTRLSRSDFQVRISLMLLIVYLFYQRFVLKVRKPITYTSSTSAEPDYSDKVNTPPRDININNHNNRKNQSEISGFDIYIMTWSAL